MALSNHGNQGESHNVVLRPPHEEPRAASSRRRSDEKHHSIRSRLASAALTDSSMETKRSDVVR